jgi:hypothetical protein
MTNHTHHSTLLIYIIYVFWLDLVFSNCFGVEVEEVGDNIVVFREVSVLVLWSSEH